jgi:hypothetical protein
VNAVIESGLDLIVYMEGGYSIEVLALAIAWVRNRNYIKLHSEDAVARKMAKK